MENSMINYNNLKRTRKATSDAVLLTNNSRAYEEKEELDLDERPMLKALILALGVKVYEIQFNIYGM